MEKSATDAAIKFTTELGRSYLSALLLEDNVNIKTASKDMNWRFQRIYSMLKTIAKQEHRKLVKVKTSVYKLGEDE